jgi:glycosyltransferase involved in cell wall biosynthesis
MPRVVAVIAVKNMASMIDSAVVSLLVQSVKDFQIIVVDNESSDDTQAVVEALRERDSRVRLQRCAIPGPFACRNQAMQDLDCDYVAVMDGDDICLPDRLELQIRALSNDPGLVAIGSQVIHFGDRIGFPRVPLGAEDCRHALSLFNPCYHPTLMLRRDALAKAGLYDLSHAVGSDFDLIRRLSYLGAVRNLEERLLLYRIHRNQISSQKKQEQESTLYRVLRKHVTYLHQGREPSDADLLLKMLRAVVDMRWEFTREALRSIRSVVSIIRRNRKVAKEVGK